MPHFTASGTAVSVIRLEPSLQRSSHAPSLSISSEFWLRYKSRMLLRTGGWETDTYFAFSAPYSMRNNRKITPEAWEKLFAVLPDTKISNLK